MKKKKAAPKKLNAKRQQSFHMRMIYIIAPVIVLAFLITINFSTQSTSKQEVLGASTTSQSSWFSFGNFFSSLFSIFTGGTNKSSSTTTPSTTNTTNNGWFKNPFASSSTQSTTSNTQTGLTQSQLETMAVDKYADGNLPLGDNKYTTSGPQTGYIYLCNVPSSNG